MVTDELRVLHKGTCSLVKKMADVFDDEAEQTVSIKEYLEGVEEQELVRIFITHNLVLYFLPFPPAFFRWTIYTIFVAIGTEEKMIV